MTSHFEEAEAAAGDEPRMHVLPRATAVRLPPGAGRIKQIESGFEHVLLLTETGEIYGTGCNTDGQIGLGAAEADVFGFTKVDLPAEIAQEGGVARISAGADTSALVTASGRVWTWGNSVRTLGPGRCYTPANSTDAVHRSTARRCTPARSTRSCGRSKSTTPSCHRVDSSSTTDAEARSHSRSTVRSTLSTRSLWRVG